MKDGGQAFPVNITTLGSSELRSEIIHGITMRDYFAAKAMQGLIADQFRPNFALESEIDLTLVARNAYLLADAMLEARGANE